MASKLNDTQLKNSHAWLHDVFIWGGLVPVTKKKRDEYYSLMYYYNASSWKQPSKKSCEVICSAITKRGVYYGNFQEIDKALDVLSNEYFGGELGKQSEPIRKMPSMLAQYIANFCAENKFYWDNSTCTTYEMDELRKTVIGKALYDYECFTSQQEAKKEKASNKAQASVTTTGAQVTKSAMPVSKTAAPGTYTTLGPLSGNVPNLVGTAGKKIQLAVSKVYWITADKVGQNTPRVYITPIGSDGTSREDKAIDVKIGSGNGYSDCTLFWADQTEAADFLNTCLNKSTHFIGNGKFSNIRVVASSVDQNGYYKVQTAFGQAYIKASKLNEEVQTTNTMIFEMFDEQDVASYEAALYRD